MSGSTVRMPPRALTMTMNSTTLKAKAILALCPMPKNRMNTGAKAMRGMALSALR